MPRARTVGPLAGIGGHPAGGLPRQGGAGRATRYGGGEERRAHLEAAASGLRGSIPIIGAFLDQRGRRVLLVEAPMGSSPGPCPAGASGAGPGGIDGDPVKETLTYSTTTSPVSGRAAARRALRPGATHEAGITNCVPRLDRKDDRTRMCSSSSRTARSSSALLSARRQPAPAGVHARGICRWSPKAASGDRVIPARARAPQRERTGVCTASPQTVAVALASTWPK